MKKKKVSLKKLAPMPAAAAVIALAASAAQAQITPVFDYGFPASWGGTGTTVTDLSSAGNNGTINNTVSLAAAVPPGSTAGTQSINTAAGGIYTPSSLLNNSAVSADGGFTYNVDFMWNGTAGASSRQYVEKLIDYAGTESLQIAATNSSLAALQMTIANDNSNEVTAVSFNNISPNTWYDISMTFNTTGNSLDASGGISGIADLYVNGTLVGSSSATKGDYGDSLGRAIGIGEFSANHQFGINILDFQGDIYNPSVDLGVAPVPEPSSLALSLLGGFGVLGMMWKARRRA